MTDLLEDFAKAVARHPDRVAIVDGKGKETTFADLKARSENYANGWHARGVRPGDRVLLAMKLDADLYAGLAALWSLGATVVLPEPAMGVAGLRHAAKVSDVSAFCSSGLYGLLKFTLPALWRLRHLRPRKSGQPPHQLPPPAQKDLALISFTSGTSGAPKAIPRSHGFMAAQHRAIAPMLFSETTERDLVAFPVFVLINIASGRTSVLPNWKMSRLASLDPAHLERWVTAQNISRALLPPALCETLANTRIPRMLHRVFTGGGPVFPDILHKLQKAQPNLQIVCVYGSTEAEPIAHINAADIAKRDHEKMQSGHGLLVGRPTADIQVRISGDEIQVAGAHVNSGYLDPQHDGENKIHDGSTIWHRTGDAGYFDAQNRLWLLGRMGSQVELSGKEQFPFTVEVAARHWPGVTQSALVAMDETACLALEGDSRHMETWRLNAAQMGITSLKHLTKIPMDKRHASKVDRKALIRQMAGGVT